MFLKYQEKIHTDKGEHANSTQKIPQSNLNFISQKRDFYYLYYMSHTDTISVK